MCRRTGSKHHAITTGHGDGLAWSAELPSKEAAASSLARNVDDRLSDLHLDMHAVGMVRSCGGH